MLHQHLRSSSLPCPIFLFEPTWKEQQKRKKTEKSSRNSVPVLSEFLNGYWHSGVGWGGVLSITKSNMSDNFGTQSFTQ